MRTILLCVVLGAFLIPTTYAVAEHGYFGFFVAALTNSASVQVFLDLGIALTLVSIWMIADTRQRGLPFISVLPYLAVTAALGSIGPLLYLLLATKSYSTAPGSPGCGAGLLRRRW